MQAFVLVLSCVLLSAAAPLANNYTIDDTPGVGRRFDGIGGLSGGGATSRLLVSYNQTYQSQILDFLFLPNFGASLHILKVEIGGDAQSTDGTESSHQHTADDLNYERGYEWWLMQEAKKRNPDILLYGLPWAFPAWVGNGSGNPYTHPQLTADYVTNWVKGAKSAYGLGIDYVGIWNERNYDATYIKTLRSTLDAASLQATKIIASDSNWNIAQDILHDKDLANAVWGIGAHYPGTTSTGPAVETGKPLWASEDYSTFNDLAGGGCWARILNQNYVNGNMTSTISWNLVASYYDSLPYTSDALMSAYYPWTGHYDVSSPIWGSAHTTQFSRPGWYYLRQGSGAGHLQQGGSYVTLVEKPGDPSGAFTIVIEKMSHDHSKCIRPALPPYDTSAEVATFHLGGSFAGTTTLKLFRTHHDFGNVSASTFFERQPDVQVANGLFTLSVEVDSLYTLTTYAGGVKGSYPAPPAAAPFPLPYADNFDGHPLNSEADYFADQAGVWEIREASVNASAHGRIMRQVVPTTPICWSGDISPISALGDKTWRDVHVQASFSIVDPRGGGSAGLAARLTGTTNADGVMLTVGVDGTWSVAESVRAIMSGPHLASGSGLSIGNATWHAISLQAVNGRASGSVDGASLFNVTIRASAGWVGFVQREYSFVEYDDFSVTAQG